MSRVVVIGGGLAGLSCAAALAAHGDDVTVLEAGSELGGKARCAFAAGARVDVGPTLLADLDPLRRLFSGARADLAGALPLTRVEPGFVAQFSGGRRVAVSADPDAFAPLGPRAADDWRRFLDLGARAARLAAHYYERGDPTGARDWMRFVLGGGVSLGDLVPFARRGSLAALLDASIETPDVRRLLAHFARFVGLDATRAPAVTAVIPHTIATSGVWHPRGGIAGLVDAVAALARGRGAALDTGSPVVRLERRGARVVAAITEGGRRCEADRFVSAVDVATTARWLGDSSLSRAVGALRPARAAHVAWWVIDGRSDAPHHALDLSERDAEPLYVATPTATDASAAPPGASIVYALVHRPAGEAPDADLAARLRARVRAAGLWPEGRVLAGGIAAPTSSCYGYAIGPSLRQSVRPSQRVAGLDNLVLAGGSVFPGPGLANVVRSGLRAASLSRATDLRMRAA